MKKIIAILLCFVCTGCATGYGSLSITGGYYDKPVTDQITKVVFSGNGYLENEAAAKYTLFRCAEIAQAKNQPYFVIYTNLNQVAFDKRSREVARGSVGGKPTTYAYLRLFSSKTDDAFSTNEVLAQLAEFKKIESAKNNGKAKAKTGGAQ